ncbi:MAG TPA: redoxin domain-containing protein [Acetobacteraceae bacterium]|jgi:cytochrome c biogenesis protein CcmG/thiol:disulfide interchange protein DsbE
MIPRRRFVLLAPLGAFAAVDAALWLLPGEAPGLIAYGPHGVASPLLGRRLPSFSLPGLGSAGGFSSSDVVGSGHPVLLNFFASWCEPCQQEMPVLLRLARQGAAIWGIDFRDRTADAEGFLRQRGDPYRRVARDDQGQVARLFGIDGVPESFLVDPSGIVRWHWVGGLDDAIVPHQLEPLLRPQTPLLRA